MDVPGSLIVTKIPSLKGVQIHHPMFPPSDTREVEVWAYLSPLEVDPLGALGHRWILTARHSPKHFVVLNQDQMVGFVNVALANNWLTKGYEPNQIQDAMK